MCEKQCNEGHLSQPSALSILDELRCGMVRPQHSANFIRLTRAASLRLVLSIVVTVMSSEICERSADSNLYERWIGLVRGILQLFFSIA